jgi:enoyl-CoA hydratase/carnithine racemase
MLEVIEHAGSIRELRLARPPVNALNAELLRAITSAVNSAKDCPAVIITGQTGMFSAGLDVPGLLAADRAGIIAVFEELWRAQQAIAMSAVPVVVCITGHCPAGGTVLALYADYRIMAEGAFKLGLNEVQVGLVAGPPIFNAFQRLVGGHAAQLLTRGALMDPVTALRVGLVDEVVEPEKCVARALDMARELAASPRSALLRTRELVRRDLRELFGAAADAERLAREFADVGAELLCIPETQQRLRAQFARKR